MRGRVQPVLLLFALLTAFPARPDDASYTVKEKETLFSIARRNQIPIDILCRANGITDASRIRAGVVLLLPQARVVGRGETIYGIAKDLGAEPGSILALNGLSDPAKVQAGDRLFLPPKPGAAKPATAAAAAAGGPETGKAPGQAAENPPQATVGAPPGSDWRITAWPHPGKRETVKGRLTGLLPGLVFHGSRGDEVQSATRGEVSWVGPYVGWGKVVIVRTTEGDLVVYAGNESLLVNRGDLVKPGTPIARLGVSQLEGEARLYFSVRTGSGKSVDPERIVKG